MNYRDKYHPTQAGKRRVMLHAIVNFAADYHSGQRSRGYRLLCRSLSACRRYGMHRPLDYGMTDAARAIYDRLVKTYAEEM